MYGQGFSRDEKKYRNLRRIPNENELAGLFSSGITSSLYIGNDTNAPQSKKKERAPSSGFNISQTSPSVSPYEQHVSNPYNRNNPTISMFGSYSYSKLSSKAYQEEKSNDQLKIKRSSCGRTSRAQNVLPGDHVVFAESANNPGIPIIYRLEEERQNNPDKLNLDRRKLSVCPILEGEDNLRLLNLQHNLIKKIEHISSLKKLIFLDLYNNQIEDISGLNGLSSLRVLMLGKNRISKINYLDDLNMLDVLDLHGNKIEKIENLSHMHHLRVLNLAGNMLTEVSHLSGLEELTEINLRRNSITSLVDVDVVQSLQRIFLSYNKIKSFSNISCLQKCNVLNEISLDGNPISSVSNYRQVMINGMTSLKMLDTKRISDEERRIANVMARKEEERRRENERTNSIKEKRRIAISNAQRQWDMQHGRLSNAGIEKHSQSDEEKTPAIVRKSILISRKTSSSSDSGKGGKSSSLSRNDYSVCHLAELDNNSLNLYGSGALDALTKDWVEKKDAVITGITFRYIKFHEIVPFLSKLNSTFSSLESLYFDLTNISSIQQINALAKLKKLSHLTITEEGNQVTNLSLWKPYAIFRLSHLNLETLNGDKVTHDDVYAANNMFGSLLNYTSSLLSNVQKMVLLAKEGYKDFDKKVIHGYLRFLRSSVKEKMEEAEHKAFASNYIREIMQNSIMADRKHNVFQNDWEPILKEVIAKHAKEIVDKDTYCEESLDRIKKSVGLGAGT